MAYQKQLMKVNWFSSSVGSSTQGYGLSHSGGEMRPNTNMLNATITYAMPSHSQTSPENGDMNENSFGGSFIGLRNKIAMPVGRKETEEKIKKKYKTKNKK